jgi:lysozyme family protein
MSFESDILIIYQNEGGKSDDPRDPGGRTNKGVTNRVYRAWKKDPTADVWNATDAELNQIYKDLYWTLAGCESLAEPLALVVFDTAVNCGVGRAKQFLIKAQNEVGPGTALFYLDIRSQFYNDLVAQRPALSVFLKGWQKRVSRLRTYCFNYKP